MKGPGVFLLAGLPHRIKFAVKGYPCIHLGGERHCES